MSTVVRHRFGKIDHPLDRHSEIVDDLTRDILRGRYQPTDRLPRWRELTEQYDTTLATVQKALDRLDEYGFIARGGWHGIRVVEHPPHLCHFGLVLPEPADASGQFRSHFLTTLAHVAGQMRNTRPRWVSVYSGVGGDRDEEFRQLAADLNARRLAGLIVTDRRMTESPRFAALLRTTRVPIAALLTNVNMSGVIQVALPPGEFMKRACAYLQTQDRRRVALVSVVNAGRTMWAAAQPALAAHGLESRPWWRVEATTLYPGALQPVMQMLCRLPASDRPDAVIVTDDNLVPDATAGLAAAGARLPRNLAIVAHTNFPLPTTSALPAVRLGFDVRRVVATCIDVLDQRNRGATLPGPVIVPVEFEGEVSSE